MIKDVGNAFRGAIGFGAGMALASLLASYGHPLGGLILGGVLGGGFLAWRTGDVRLMLVSAVAVNLGLFLGGLVVVMSFGIIAYAGDGDPGRPALGTLLAFYLVFIVGFAVAGASISAATAARLVTPRNAVMAFAIGGVIGGAVIIGGALVHFLNGSAVIAAVTMSLVVAGALCGGSWRSSKDVSLSIR